MTITISAFHLPIVLFVLVAVFQTYKTAVSRERDPFYGLSIMLPGLVLIALTTVYYGLYFWFKFVS